MRFGLIRDIEGLPPCSLQRRLVEKAGCDLVIEEAWPTRASIKAQRKLLFDLKAGDELVVPSLHTLQMSTGELVLLFRKFEETGVTLRIAGEDSEKVLALSGRARPLLALLAGNEALRPDRQRAPRRSRPRTRPLTRYQIDYAIELRRRGASLRTIGQLFQVAPSDLQDLLVEQPRGRPDIPADIQILRPGNR
ncbi:MAG TPA: hypothetical protein VHN73_07345 [Phenylobacterium sp.]|nr:hypothetical protein [Phenylobacterium sp.]